MQLAANQANALLSTGPVTDAGKAIASRNSLSHGLTSAKVLQPGDSQEEYDAFAADHVRVYTPGDLTESALVDKIVASNWRFRHALETEAAFIGAAAAQILEQEPQLSRTEAEARIFLDKSLSRQLSLIMRYKRSIERTGEKALTELRRLQKIRYQEELIKRQLESLAERQAPAEPEQNGSVSQKPRMPRLITRRRRKEMREAARKLASGVDDRSSSAK
jgi:hypothetical protein